MRQNKVEVLARELCTEYWAGMRAENPSYTDLKTFAEANYHRWEKRAARIIDTLEKHK